MCSSPLPDIVVGLGLFRMEDEAEAEEGESGGVGDRNPQDPDGAPALVGGHGGASHFVERTEHPGKLWLVALNLKNMFASPRKTSGCKNCPPDFLSILG